jgi:hypothetical protein
MFRSISIVFLCILFCYSCAASEKDITRCLTSNNEDEISNGLLDYSCMPDDSKMDNVDYIIRLTDHASFHIRDFAILLLGEIFLDFGREEGVVVIHKSKINRIKISNKVIKASKKVVPVLIKKLSDPDQRIVKRSLESIEFIGPLADDAIPSLVIIIETKTGEIREEAIIALGNMGPRAKSAIPVLEKCVKSNNEYESGLAIWSIKEIRNGVQ